MSTMSFAVQAAPAWTFTLPAAPTVLPFSYSTTPTNLPGTPTKTSFLAGDYVDAELPPFKSDIVTNGQTSSGDVYVHSPSLHIWFYGTAYPQDPLVAHGIWIKLAYATTTQPTTAQIGNYGSNLNLGAIPAGAIVVNARAFLSPALKSPYAAVFGYNTNGRITPSTYNPLTKIGFAAPVNLSTLVLPAGKG